MITYREYFKRLAEGERVQDIAEEIGINRSTLREAIKRGGWDVVNGRRGSNSEWQYTGTEPEPLDEPLRVGASNRKSAKKFLVERSNELKNETTKELLNERTNEGNNGTTKELSNQRSNVGTEEQKNEPIQTVRKRASFDLDVDLLKRLKMEAILRDKNIYEMVEEAIKKYLED